VDQNNNVKIKNVGLSILKCLQNAQPMTSQDYSKQG
jgi:hypothetical protein